MRRWMLTPLTAALVALALMACDNALPVSVQPPALVGNSAAYGIWTPGPRDNCNRRGAQSLFGRRS